VVVVVVVVVVLDFETKGGVFLLEVGGLLKVGGVFCDGFRCSV